LRDGWESKKGEATVPPTRSIEDLEVLIDKVLLTVAHQQAMSGFYMVDYSINDPKFSIADTSKGFVAVDTDFAHMLGYQKSEVMELNPMLTTHPDWYDDVIWARRLIEREENGIGDLPIAGYEEGKKVAYYKMMLSKEGQGVKTQVLWASSRINNDRAVSFCYARKVDEFPYRNPPIQPYEQRALDRGNVTSIA
jgi:hypothetical protein